MAFCLMLFVTLVPMADPQAVAGVQPSDGDLIRLFRDGSSEERRSIDRSLIHDHAKPLPDKMQTELFGIFASRDLPGELRENAMYVLLETSGAPIKFAEELERIARNRKESAKVRAHALRGIQSNLRGRPDSPRMSELLLEILQDQAEDLLLRQTAAVAVVETAVPADQLLATLKRIVGSRDETVDCRLEMMQIAMVVVVAASKSELCASLASLHMKLGSDETESVYVRVGTLKSLADLMIYSRLAAIEFPDISRKLSRELFNILAHPKKHRRIRDAAGQALQVCPMVDPTLIDGLNTLLNSEDRFIHEYAVGTLRGFGADAKSSVPRLIEIWKDMNESKETQAAAKDALLTIDPDRASQLGIREE